MSTTLVPTSYYVVKPHGHPARLYDTLTEVTAAIYLLGRTPATVSAVTGSRRRSLTDAELRDGHDPEFEGAHDRARELPLAGSHALANPRAPRPAPSPRHPGRPAARVGR
jgi:hypothetical protein